MATPQETQQILQEIANRGLVDSIPVNKRPLFDEAVRRGLIQLPTTTAATAPVAQTQPQEVESNIFREIADVPINLLSGIATGTRMLTDIGGATNPVSESIRGVEGYLQNLLSAQAKADKQEVARIMSEAEDMGVGPQLRAAARAFMVSPIDFLAQGAGTVVPGVVAGVAAGIPGLIGYGGASGVGLVKSAIFDAVNEALVEQGRSPEEARQAAEEAQAYTGDNLDMIALGGVLGYAATRFGVQPALIQKKLGDRLIQEGVSPGVARSAVNEAVAQETLERGVLSNLGRTAASEALPEAAQAGQEQFAQNLALQREDIAVPLMRGVVGSAALEGGIGALLGGGVGAVEAQRADTEIAERQAARAAQTAFEEETGVVTEEQRQADADAAALFLEGTIEPTPIETAKPLTIDDTASSVAREWAPVIAAEVQKDSQGEIDRAAVLEKRQELAETYGEEAAAAYGRAMMDAINAQLQAQQEAPAARAAQQTQFEADEAEAARLAGESIAARMAAEQAAAAPTVEPVTEQAAPAVEEVVTWETMRPGQAVTLYRGESAENEAGGQFWTSNKAKAEKYGNVIEVTLPSEVIGRNAAIGANGIDEFVFTNSRPLELAAEQATPATAQAELTVAEEDAINQMGLLEETELEQVAAMPGVESLTVALPATPTGATRGRPRVERSPEAAQRAAQLSRAGDAERQRNNRVTEGFKVSLYDRAQKVLGKKKYAGAFATPEEFDAYAANPEEARAREVEANIAAGMSPAKAERAANKKQGVFNAAREELESLKAARIDSLIEVMKIASNPKLEGKASYAAARETLLDPNIPQAEFDAAALKARIDAEQFGRAPAIPTRAERAKPATTKPQTETDAVTDAELKSELESEIDDAEQSLLQKEINERIDAVEKDKTLISTTVLPEEVQKETTGAGLFGAIAKLNGATPFEKSLALILKRMTNLLGTKVVVFTDPNTVPENIRSIFFKGDKVVTAGLYDPESGTIYLHLAEGGDTRTALHEGVHAVTVDMLDSYFVDKNSVPEGSREAIAALLELMVSAGNRYAQLKLAGRTTPELDAAAESTKNFTDLKEFLSYGITTPALQRMLLGMPPVSRGFIAGVVSAFNDLTKSLARMIGLPSTDYSAFTQLLDLTGVVAWETLSGTPYKASEIAQAKNFRRQVSTLQQAKAIQNRINMVLGKQKSLYQLLRDPKAAIEQMRYFGKYVTGRAYRAMLQAFDTNMLTALANTKDYQIGMADRLAKLMQDLVSYRSQRIDASSRIAKDWETYIAKNPANAKPLTDLFNDSTLFNIVVYDVDSKTFLSVKNSIDNDQEVKDLRPTISLLEGIPLQNRTREEKAALTIAKKELADRVQSITELFQRVAALKAMPNGQGAMDIYARVQDKYRADVKEAVTLLLDTIRKDTAIPGTEADISSDKGSLMANIVADYTEMLKLKVYSPLSRPGRFALNVTDATGKRVFYKSFETDGKREDFIREYELQFPTDLLTRVDQEDKAETMRDLLLNDSTRVTDLFERIDKVASGAPDAAKDLKDSIYQLYLQALPSGAARKSVVNRKGVLGFEEDALRSFAINQSTLVNQLARLKYGNQIRNEIAAGKKSLEGIPATDKNIREKTAIIDTLAERATVTLSPPSMGSMEEKADAASRLGTKASFLFMLTSMRSAIIQPTQLIMFGFGGLHAKFGAGKTAAMAAKYMGNFLTARALSRTELDESGNVVDEKGEAAMRNSKYVTESPIKDALQKAYDVADVRNLFIDTRASDLAGSADAQESELRQAGGGTSISKGAQAGLNLVSAPIHHAERVSREVFFMSAFELAYEKQLAQGKKGDAAIEAATEQAIELTKTLMFDYSALNKPLFAKTWYGRMGYQFMTYRVQALAHIVTNFYKAFAASGLTKAEKKEAAVMFWDTIGMGLFFGGVTGMFGYTAMVALIDGLREALRPDLDDEDADLYYDIDDAGNPLGLRSIDLYFRNYVLDKYFGPGSGLANFMGLTPEQAQQLQRGVELGVPSALTDWNVQSSMSLDGLIYNSYGRQDNSLEDTAVNLAFDTMFGPSASLARNFLKGYETMVNEGEIARGLEMMAPAFLREPLEAMRFATDGNVTRAGDVLKPEEYYTGWKVVGQALGFGSAEVAESQVSTFAARKLIDEIKAEKVAVYDNFEKAFKERNAAVDQYGPESRQAIVAGNRFDDALQEVRRYNYKNFFDGITTDDLMSSLGERLRRDGITDEGLYLGDAVAPYLYRIVMPSRTVTNPPEEAQ